MFGINKKKSASAMEKDIKSYNAATAISVAAHKISNAGFGVAGAGTAVIGGNSYLAAQKKHLSRKDRKKCQQIYKIGAGATVIGIGVGSVAMVVEAIAQPMPFDQSKYVFDDDDIEDAVADAEKTVDGKIASDENKEGAEQNAQ